MAIVAEDRSKLLELARVAVEASVRGGPPPETPEPSGVLAEKRGCFVTLKNRGRLRGCIGQFSPRTPLAETIVQMGRAATQDPRFISDPVTPDELPELTIEVSVLSPLKQTYEPEKLQVGKHGIYIQSPHGSGCFLPEVATEMRWNTRQFLDNCCSHKAGLPAGAWRMIDTKVFLFTSEKFAAPFAEEPDK